MSMPITLRWLTPDRTLRHLLLKWIVALLVPVVLFNFVWNGEMMINDMWLATLTNPRRATYLDPSVRVQAAFFLLVFYTAVIALTGYLVAVDSGRRGILELWSDICVYIVIPILLIVLTQHLLIGLGLSIAFIPLYFFVRTRVRKLFHYTTPVPVVDIPSFDAEQGQVLYHRARTGSIWFATLLSLIWLVFDLIFYFSGDLADILLAWVGARTVLLPLLGYALGSLAGWFAVRQARRLATNGNGEETNGSQSGRLRRLRFISEARVREEARNLVPNDQPLQSRGAWTFYLVILFVFVLLYPAIDRGLFGSGTAGRLSGYSDLGYYIILALGLNIVVGFAGLLDLGYVAFFVLGTYTWAMIGSSHFTTLTSIPVNGDLWPWLFWPMLIISALVAAVWGILLGAPTLRLRGDYLAIVTLGFGEIIPIVFLQLEPITRGINGIVGIYPPATPCIPPALPCIEWSSVNPTPFYYLILALIVLSIFANIRLRDSRMGRAWIAIREDEIAASSSGVNLVRTKLFAFAAGAFFSGIAGAYRAAVVGTVTPKDFNSTDSIIYLAMVVIGGLGSIPGVILGAIVVYSLNVLILPQLDSMASVSSSFMYTVKTWIPIENFQFRSIRYLLFGLLIVLVMIFRPEGLIPSARRSRELHQSAETTPDEGSLDQPPGAAAFETETR